MEKCNANTMSSGDISLSTEYTESANATGVYTATCHDADGNLKWTDTYSNLVLTAGKNNLLDTYLTGSAYTAAWYLGLVDGTTTPTYAAADTSASHAGWTENVAYSNSARPTPAWNTAAAGSKATTATAFNINGTATIAGTFLINVSTKSGTTGIVYSAGSFTGGNKIVASGDTLNVTYTAAV
jgi:hypothetical protein